MTRWGFTFPLNGIPLAQHREVLREAEGLGYTDAWTLEVDGADAFVPLALAAAWTRDLHLGTAISNVFTRGPATLAMTAASMAEAAPGRFILGVGASTHVIVENWNSGRLMRPVPRVHDMVTFLRKALSGEKVSVSLETLRVEGFRLSRPVTSPVPIFIAALRSRMLKLAASLGDGIILNWLSAADVAKVVAVARKAAQAAGRDPETLEMACRIFVSASEDPEESRRMARRFIAGYLTTPAYAKFQRWLGRGELLRPMMEAWLAGDRRSALQLIPDAVVDDLIVFGDVGECLEKIDAYCRQGVTLPILYFLPTAVEPQEQAAQCLLALRELGKQGGR
ncbi:MAG: LLM class F420-dependent oxidoreductase [Dehalococcoidia bacterium]